MMTSQQLADELKRIATTQVSDITRAVKEGVREQAEPAADTAGDPLDDAQAA